MNYDPEPHAAEVSLRRVIGQAEDFVRREPGKAVVAAFGVGLALRVLPPRFVGRAAGTLLARVLPPTLLALGVLKAFELCCEHEHTESRAP